MRGAVRSGCAGVLLLICGQGYAGASEGAAGPFVHAPAPPDNPLKGFCPYAGQAREFPHSLEFSYFPLSDLMDGPDHFTWDPLEAFIRDVNSRGCQAVFRVYLTFPGKPSGIPKFLVDGGLMIHRCTQPASRADPGTDTPDYADPRLRAALRAFIAALGKRYDGDPRIGYVTAGLLGFWGEWHTSPCDGLMAGRAVRDEVMDAFQKSFRETPILLRYPGEENARRPFGYHDDSFAWATLPVDRRRDDWFFVARLEAAGKEALDKWKTRPIGGEVRPETWGTLWDEKPGVPPGQEFQRCVEATHASWLMDSSIARPLAGDRLARAVAGARRLGYEFQVTGARVARSRVRVTVRNTGAAPLYRRWPVRLVALDEAGNRAAEWGTDWNLSGLLPGDPDRVWEQSPDLTGLAPGRYRLGISVPNPMPGGRPLRFADRAQDRDAPGVLTLGTIRLR